MAIIAKRPNKHPRRRYLFIGLVVIAVALACLAYMRISQKPAENFTTAGKGQAQSKSDNKRSDKPVGYPDTNVPGGATGGSDQPGPANPPVAALPVPSGSLVSNHRPNLGGSPAPNTLNSTCITVANAKCEIHFTQGAVTKALPAKIATDDGTVSWDWKLQDVGLTEGSWKVEAIASQGGQIRTAQDTLSLEVRP